MNHEYYVSLEVAKLLKEARFDWECHDLYEKAHMLYEKAHKIHSVTSANWNTSTKYYSAPTLEVAQSWLRDVKGVFICVAPEIKDYHATWNFYICSEQGFFYENEDCFLTYEESKEAGIKQALEIILEKGE